MLFQTPTFFLFFIIFFIIYFLTRKKLTIQNIVVLVGSYVFYGAWDERFLTLIIASTATDYLAGIGASGQSLSRKNLITSSAYLLVGSAVSLSQTYSQSAVYFLYVVALIIVFWGVGYLEKCMTEQTRKKFFVVFSIIVNIGLLAIFKYLNFFADSLQAMASNLGYQFNYASLDIVLPVGISFYTFQTLSYSIDIYRGKLKPCHNFLSLAVFVAFFPQLVAGPIERATNLLPQFEKMRVFTVERFKTGSALFIWGLFKKVFIADNLARIADKAFSNPGTLESMELLVGLLAFTFQIFCDFSGYSDMARGLARMLGFDLMLNFKIPYIACTPSEFWQRWHISLSSWLRDYLYIPLGGNKRGELNTYRNLSLTMILGGLWHGASWTFVLWGAFHGMLLIIYRFLNIDDKLEKIRSNRTIGVRYAIEIAAIGIMFVLTLYGWLIFRAHSVDLLVTYSSNLLSFTGGLNLLSLGDVFYYIWPLVLVQCVQLYKKKMEIFEDMPQFVQVNVSLFCLYCIIFLKPWQTAAFIYFDF